MAPPGKSHKKQMPRRIWPSLRFSHFPSPFEESRPAAFSRATTNQTADIGERSDTPQFPVTERTETPLPYHPLLYRRDNTTEEMVTQRQQWAPNGQKIDEPTTTSSNRNNSNTTMNRWGTVFTRRRHGKCNK